MLNTVTFTVKGVTFEGRQGNLKEVAKNPDFKVKFARDKENPVDKNAVKVLAESLTDWVEIGYVPKEIAANLVNVKQVNIFKTEILGGTEEKPTYGMLIGMEVESDDEISSGNNWEKDPVTANQKKFIDNLIKYEGAPPFTGTTKGEASKYIETYKKK